jgi:hypothetical protein
MKSAPDEGFLSGWQPLTATNAELMPGDALSHKGRGRSNQRRDPMNRLGARRDKTAADRTR